MRATWKRIDPIGRIVVGGCALVVLVPVYLVHWYIWRPNKEAIKTALAVVVLLAILGGLAYLQGYGIRGS